MTIGRQKPIRGHMPLLPRAVVFMLGAILVSPAAHAQHVATSFNELQRDIQLGERVYVTDSRGMTVKGNLAGLTSIGLEIRTGRSLSTPPLRMMEADVNNIVVERVDRIWNGALIGLAIGAGAGVLIELGGRTEYQKFSGSGAVGLGSLTGLTGLLIDVFNRQKTIVYVHAPAGQP